MQIKEKPAKIKVETWYGKFSVECTFSDPNVCDFFEDLVIPVMLAAGYSESSIYSYLEIGSD